METKTNFRVFFITHFDQSFTRYKIEVYKLKVGTSFGLSVPLGSLTNKIFLDCITKNWNLSIIHSISWEKFQVLGKEYNSFTKKHQGFEQLPLQEEMSRNDNHIQLIPHLYYVLPTVDDFKKAEHISKISAVITELYGFLLRFSDLKKEMDLYSSN